METDLTSDDLIERLAGESRSNNGRNGARTGEPGDETEEEADPRSDGQPSQAPMQVHATGNAANELRPVRRYTAGALEDAFPELHRPVVDGLVRECETINIVSVSKIGKSWLLYSLLLCIVTGGTWLGRFVCRKGRVLMLDNELHPPTIARRIKTVAQAMGMQRDEYAEMLEIVPLRGLGWSILDIAHFLETLNERFALIAVDAKYRAMPAGASENDNAAETRFYNEVDRIAETTGSAIALVHHSSKGNQGEKRLVDVGSGAGSQSRAADCHLILREHEEAGVAVLDAAVRSFAPIEPLALRWEFPLWVPDGSLDVTALKGRQSNGSKAEQDAETDAVVLNACQTWSTVGDIMEATSYGEYRIKRATGRLLKRNHLQQDIQDRPRNKGCKVYQRSIWAP